MVTFTDRHGMKSTYVLIKSRIKLLNTYFRAAALNEVYQQHNAVNTNLNSTLSTPIESSYSTQTFPAPNVHTQPNSNQNLHAQNPYQQATPYPVTSNVPSINNREGYEVYEAGQVSGYAEQEPAYVSKYSK